MLANKAQLGQSASPTNALLLQFLFPLSLLPIVTEICVPTKQSTKHFLKTHREGRGKGANPYPHNLV